MHTYMEIKQYTLKRPLDQIRNHKGNLSILRQMQTKIQTNQN